MVDVRVREEHVVNVEWENGEADVLINVFSLLHTVIHKDVFPAGAEISTAARDFVGCTDKCQLHSFSPIILLSSISYIFVMKKSNGLLLRRRHFA